MSTVILILHLALIGKSCITISDVISEKHVESLTFVKDEFVPVSDQVFEEFNT